LVAPQVREALNPSEGAIHLSQTGIRLLQLAYFIGNTNLKIISIEAIPYDLPTIRPHKLAMATIKYTSLASVRRPSRKLR
jgi:hypothetical protein